MLNLANLRVQLRLGRLPLKIRIKNYKKLNLVLNDKNGTGNEKKPKSEQPSGQILMKNALKHMGKLLISEAKEIQEKLIKKTNKK